MEKITEIAISLINGNWLFNKNKVKRLSKTEFLNLIQEYCELSGEDINKVIQDFKRIY
jgi:hypothetical protein